MLDVWGGKKLRVRVATVVLTLKHKYGETACPSPSGKVTGIATVWCLWHAVRCNACCNLQTSTSCDINAPSSLASWNMCPLPQKCPCFFQWCCCSVTFRSSTLWNYFTWGAQTVWSQRASFAISCIVLDYSDNRVRGTRKFHLWLLRKIKCFIWSSD